MIEKWNEVMKELNSGFKWLRITLNYGFLKPQDWIHDFNWILISFAKFWSLWNCNGMFQISFRFLNSLKNLGDSKIKKLFYDWSEILKYFGDFSSVLLEIFIQQSENSEKKRWVQMSWRCFSSIFAIFTELFICSSVFVFSQIFFWTSCGYVWSRRHMKSEESKENLKQLKIE